MALDYLSIPGVHICAFMFGLMYSTDIPTPATGMQVERVFSKGRLMLSHVRSQLSAQTSRAMLCVGEWSRIGLVRSEDLKSAAALLDVESEEFNYEMKEGWDRIEASISID